MKEVRGIMTEINRRKDGRAGEDGQVVISDPIILRPNLERVWMFAGVHVCFCC